MQINIAEFKARNATAQSINAEIQKAQGAIEENKRQFEKLCKEYEEQFGEHVDEKNLAEILARVTADVQAQAEAQAIAIEKAKAGIVVTTEEPNVAPTATPAASTPTQAPTPATAPVTPPQTPAAPAQTTANVFTAPPIAPAVAESVFTPPPVQTPINAAVAGIQAAQPNPVIQPPTSNGTATEPKPVSAAALSAAALQQANAVSVPDMTQQINATQPKDSAMPTFEAVSIPGWSIPKQESVDFNAMLGGAFGGGNK